MNDKSIFKIASIVIFALLLTLPIVNAVGNNGTVGKTDETIKNAKEHTEMVNNTYRNASANGRATFLRVEGYHPWAALVVNAGSPRGVDKVVLTFTNQTLKIEVTDDNHTNHVNIVINKEFADKYIANSTGDIEFNLSEAVNYRGLNNTNETEEDSKNYVFHIKHFSTQVIELSKQVSKPDNDFEPPVKGGRAFNNQAQNAAANGAATFLRIEGYKPWAVLIINAGNPHGVDQVTASFENDTLIINAEDGNHSNHVTIIVNKDFADEYLAESENDLKFNLSDAVNYEGMKEQNGSAGGNDVYVFHIEHFSTQTIEISSESSIPFVSLPVIMIVSLIPVAIYSKLKKE